MFLYFAAYPPLDKLQYKESLQQNHFAMSAVSALLTIYEPVYWCDRHDYWYYEPEWYGAYDDWWDHFLPDKPHAIE